MSDGPPLPGKLTIPSDKISRYLLNSEHPKGGAKARFFRSFGYEPDTAEDFASAVFAQALASRRWEVVPTEFGARIVTCIGRLATPSGETPWVKSVWMVGHDGSGSLVTVVPDHDPDR